MFTVGNLILGSIAALIVGLSKTAFPGAALVATPIFATIVSGRLIAGTTLPILIFARPLRRDLVRPSHPLGPVAADDHRRQRRVRRWRACSSPSSARRRVRSRSSSVCRILLMAAMQSWRMFHGRRRSRRPRSTAAVYGSSGGFTTFVANAAGPILNTYLVRLGLGKDETGRHLGLVLLRRQRRQGPGLPGARALDELAARSSPGARWRSMLLLFPAVLVGLFSGRRLLHSCPSERS